MDRPLKSRTDLPELAKLDRSAVLALFGSFDERGLDELALVRGVAGLLDPARVAGLREAAAGGEAAALARAVERALPPGSPAPPTALSAEGRRLADDALEHRFTFYEETHRLPSSIDWDANPGTGHWGHDLNRFTYLEPLVEADAASGEARYGLKAVGLILDWIDACDVGRCFAGSPYAFGSYLNNAIHAAAWARCLRALLPRGRVSPRALLLVLKSLHDQLAYLEVVTNGHHGNWPTIGCRGILEVLALFPVFRDTDRFASYAVRTLAAQIDEQVLPDGVQDELTPHYHAGVALNLISAAESLRVLGRTLEARTLEALRRMLRYQQQTILPDGSAQVAFNDSDPEVVPRVSAPLERLGLADALVPEEALGPELYPYAGVAFLRQRRSEGDLFLAFDGGPFGRGHQHEDKLGFWLFAYGRSFLVDPGRHLYDHSAVSYYDYLRSTRAHSTLLIDGEGQHSRGRPETWIAQAPAGVRFESGPEEVRARASYDLGYGPENAIAAVHTREIVFVRRGFWVVFDRVTGEGGPRGIGYRGGEGEHRIEARFQFGPGDLAVSGLRAVTTFADANLLLWSSDGWQEVRVEKGAENPRGGWYSRSYGHIAPAPALVLTRTAPLPFLAATLLLPYRGARAPETGFLYADGAATVRLAGADPIAVRTTLVQ